MFIKPLLQWTGKEHLTLSHLHLTVGYAEACDGFGLVRVPGEFPGEALLRGDDLRAIRAGLREAAEVELDTDHALVRVGKAEYRVRLGKHAYPDTGAIWPQEEPVLAIKLAAPLLKRVAELARAYGPEEWTAVQMTFFGPDRPTVFTIPSPWGLVKGLIMPMLR